MIHRFAGFTIIEVMLFLAISGLMLAGVMIGVNTSLNYQRYNDAVSSFTDFWQEQYNLVDNVQHVQLSEASDQLYNTVCKAKIATGTTDALRGVSDCTLVGRYVVSENGQDIISRMVIATATPETYPEDEEGILDAMQLMVLPDGLAEDIDDYSMLWQTDVRSVTGQDDTGASTFSALIIRFPVSSLVRTYVQKPVIATNNLAAFWDSPKDDVVLCVRPQGLLVGNNTSGVALSPYASSTNSIKYTPPSEGLCDSV